MKQYRYKSYIKLYYEAMDMNPKQIQAAQLASLKKLRDSMEQLSESENRLILFGAIVSVVLVGLAIIQIILLK